MKITILKTREVPPYGLLNEGESRDLPDDIATALIKTGMASKPAIKKKDNKKEESDVIRG